MKPFDLGLYLVDIFGVFGVFEVSFEGSDSQPELAPLSVAPSQFLVQRWEARADYSHPLDDSYGFGKISIFHIYGFQVIEHSENNIELGQGFKKAIVPLQLPIGHI